MGLKEVTDRFLSMLDEHKGIIYKVANSYCRDAEDRRDLIQDIIIQLWESFDKYDDAFKRSTWIYRIALNVSISFYRKGKRRKEMSSPFSEDVLYVQEEDKFEKDDRAFLLRKFISELKDIDRALMILYLEEKSHSEISKILGLTETNVATKIGRIRERLRERFFDAKPGM